MAIESAPVAQAAAEFIDDLEDRFGEDAELVRFAIVAEVADDEESCVRILVDASGDELGPTERVGLMARAFTVAIEMD